MRCELNARELVELKRAAKLKAEREPKAHGADLYFQLLQDYAIGQKMKDVARGKLSEFVNGIEGVDGVFVVSDDDFNPQDEEFSHPEFALGVGASAGDFACVSLSFGHADEVSIIRKYKVSLKYMMFRGGESELVGSDSFEEIDAAIQWFKRYFEEAVEEML